MKLLKYEKRFSDKAMDRRTFWEKVDRMNYSDIKYVVMIDSITQNLNYIKYNIFNLVDNALKQKEAIIIIKQRYFPSQDIKRKKKNVKNKKKTLKIFFNKKKEICLLKKKDKCFREGNFVKLQQDIDYNNLQKNIKNIANKAYVYNDIKSNLNIEEDFMLYSNYFFYNDYEKNVLNDLFSYSEFIVLTGYVFLNI
jgi:hypothetical protein